MKIQEIIKALEELAPLALQEDYDNAGLTVGDRNEEVRSVLCTIDVTEEVINEAIKLKSNMIVSHHPVIFNGLKSLTGITYNERIIIQAIKHDIALYASHTNIDNVSHGVNQKICEKLGLSKCKVLNPLGGKLVKLITFVPEKYADKVRTALFESGAGNIGHYDSCSFNSSGTGTFKGDKDTNPFAGEKGKLHNENEIRIETIVPDHLLSRVVNQLLLVHPFQKCDSMLHPNTELHRIHRFCNGVYQKLYL